MCHVLFIIFVFLGCSAHKPFGYPAPENRHDCMQLFVDVLEMQGLRNLKMMAMDEARKKFLKGDISERKYFKIRDAWLKEEKQLRSNVTHIYDVGYEYGCFDEVPKNE